MPAAGEAQPFSDELSGWLESPGPKTIGGLGEVFGERSFAVALLVLMFPASLPIPTGGVTHLLALFGVLFAVQMVLGRELPWLPARWQHHELGESLKGKALPFVVRRIRSLERISRPRARFVFAWRGTPRLLGLLLISFAVAVALAPPFSGLDTLPALGAVVICLAIIMEDAILLAVGSVLGVTGVTLLFALGAAAFSYLTKFW